jgi:hypothetical protein
MKRPARDQIVKSRQLASKDSLLPFRWPFGILFICVLVCMIFNPSNPLVAAAAATVVLAGPFLTVAAACRLVNRALAFPDAIRARRSETRASRGLCILCGYSLIGNESGVCPECGTSISEVRF